MAESYEQLVEAVDAVYIATPHLSHYALAKYALEQGKHVLCETPMTLNGAEARELFQLLEANKTAYCPAFNHLMTMIKSGVIGEVVDVEASESKVWGDPTLRELDPAQAGGSLYELGSYPLLPIFRILGTDYQRMDIYSRMENGVDVYTKGVLRFEKAMAPWWKTDFFELRYEDQNQNKKFFYKWDGEGLRYEVQEFVSCIYNKRQTSSRLRRVESIRMAEVMEQFGRRINVVEI